MGCGSLTWSRSSSSRLTVMMERAAFKKSKKNPHINRIVFQLLSLSFPLQEFLSSSCNLLGTANLKYWKIFKNKEAYIGRSATWCDFIFVDPSSLQSLEFICLKSVVQIHFWKLFAIRWVFLSYCYQNKYSMLHIKRILSFGQGHNFFT